MVTVMNRTALIAAIAVLAYGPAFAEFEIEDARTASQQVEMEIVNSISVGSVRSGDIRSEHSFGVNYGAFRFWDTGFAVEIENRQGDTFDLGAIEWSNNFQIVGSGEGETPSPYAVSLYSAWNFNLDGSEDITFTVGPVFEVVSGPTSVVTNTFFEIPIGEDGATSFDYAMGVMYDVGSGLDVGVEIHGEIEQVFDGAPSVNDQEHFAGPALDYEFVVDDGEVDFHFGTFIGLTDATPDVGVAANLNLGF
ncbi:MAG: hypothetical protein AAFN27_19935 [Pseudomonadota bacterium]